MRGATHTHVYAERFEPLFDELCQTWWSCTVSDGLSTIWISLQLGALAFALIVALAHLQRARSVVKEERSRVSAEQAAFESFAEKVDDMPADAITQPPPKTEAPVASMHAAPEHRETERIEEAYRDTVMSVSHYDADYGETFFENLCIELGQDVAVAVSEGTQLSPTLKQLLVSKTRQSVEARDRYMESLDREIASLTELHARLKTVESELETYDSNVLSMTPFPNLIDRWTRLSAVEVTVIEALNVRGDELNAEPLNHQDSRVPSLHENLYRPLSVDYPALSDGVAVLDRVRECRRLVVDEVCSRK